MCTEKYCPCPQNTDFSQWNEAVLNRWGRYYNPSSLLNNSSLVQLYKSFSGTTYLTFEECYEHINTLKDRNDVKVRNGTAS